MGLCWVEGLGPTTLCRQNMLFCHCFKNDVVIFAFIAYKCLLCNGIKNQLGVGGTKVVGHVGRASKHAKYRLRRRWLIQLIV